MGTSAAAMMARVTGWSGQRTPTVSSPAVVRRGCMDRLWPEAPALEWREWAVMAVVTLYFIGTVLHVKALIRERNDPRSAPRCIAYHAVLAVLTVCAVVVGWLTWWWIPWALLLVVRALLMPRARRKPGVIGAVEIVNSVLLLALVLFA